MKKIIVGILALGALSAQANCLEKVTSVTFNKDSIQIQGTNISSLSPAEITYYFTSNQAIDSLAATDAVKAIRSDLIICNEFNHSKSIYVLKLAINSEEL